MGRKGEAKRQQLLDTAKQMLLDGGVEAFVLRDVAERVGITHGNLQYYFRTKQDLMVAIFDQEVAKYTDSLQEAVAATTTRRGRLGAIIDAGLKELRSPDTALWRMVMSMADHSPDMAALLKKENDLYQAVVARELKQIAPQLSTQAQADRPHHSGDPRWAGHPVRARRPGQRGDARARERDQGRDRGPRRGGMTGRPARGRPGPDDQAKSASLKVFRTLP
jgi:AcrR family transcriptional regulator